MELDLELCKNFLCSLRLLTEERWQAASVIAGTKQVPVADILISDGHITEDDWLRVQSHVAGVAIVDLTGQTIDHAILTIIPEPLVRKHQAVVISRRPEGVEVAFANLADVEVIKNFLEPKGLRIIPRLTTSASIKCAVLNYQQYLKNKFGSILKSAGEPQVLLEALLGHAKLSRASTIHLDPSETGFLVRYRIGGFLYEAMVLDETAAKQLIAFVKDFKTDKFEANFLPAAAGESLVLRLLNKNSSGFSLAALDFSAEKIEEIHQVLNQRQGLILVSLPEAAKRLATLYAVLDLVNKPERSIVTIEDPIEYRLAGINQLQVKKAAGLDFATGLRLLLKHDPDVVMISSLEDRETAELAIAASITGKLVLAGIDPTILDSRLAAASLVVG